MSNIEIITFFEAPNYGAFWQAFALKKYLEEQGHNVLFLKHQANKRSYPINSEDPIKKFKYELNKQIIGCKKYLTTTNKSYEEEETMYDVAILGSDEIWNYSNYNYDKLPIFWGRKVHAKKIISYAPSAAGMSIKWLLIHPLSILALNRIKSISVRDDNTEKLISSVTRKKIVRVLDPTFLIDYTDIVPKINKKNYILVYSYGLQDYQKEWIIKYSKLVNKKIIFTGKYCDWADENPTVDPFQWLALIQNSDFVFSTTFHGTVFALIFRKQFMCLGENAKIKSLVKEFNLSNRVVTNKEEFDKEIEKSIDYEDINKIIEKRKKESQQFLLDNI